LSRVQIVSDKADDYDVLIDPMASRMRTIFMTVESILGAGDTGAADE
jgi:hypothetical protein